MFRSGIIGDEVVISWLVPDGVKTTSQTLTFFDIREVIIQMFYGQQCFIVIGEEN